MNDVITFEEKWCKNEALCSVIDGQIFFFSSTNVEKVLCVV